MVTFETAIPDSVLPRLVTEVLSLTQNQIYSAANQSTQIDLKLPNSMFINGIVLSHDNYQTCDKIEIGKINYIRILTIIEVFFIEYLFKLFYLSKSQNIVEFIFSKILTRYA